MGDINLKYSGASETTITITLAGLTNGSFRQALAVDNGTTLFIDALVAGKIKTGTTPIVDSAINFYAAASSDGGTTYSGDASGTDLAYTGRSEQLFLIGQVSVSAVSDTTYEFGPFSIASAFGGILPDMWTIIVENDTNVTLSTSEPDSDVHFMGVEINAA